LGRLIHWLGGTILLAAGLWQLTSLKGVCLRHCRSPLSFLAQQWRPGRLGAFRMGLEHGAYCLGCCWFLMGRLFFWRHHEPVLDWGVSPFSSFWKRQSRWATGSAGSLESALPHGVCSCWSAQQVASNRWLAQRNQEYKKPEHIWSVD
jgi:hypothetical protein